MPRPLCMAILGRRERRLEIEIISKSGVSIQAKQFAGWIYFTENLR